VVVCRIKEEEILKSAYRNSINKGLVNFFKEPEYWRERIHLISTITINKKWGMTYPY
jgi:hypothetical protein